MATVYVEETELATPRAVLQKNQVANARVQWGAIFAGLFVTVLTYFGLVWLGLAFGSATLQDNVQVQNWDALRDLGVGASVWTVLSALFSIGVGSYVSARIAGLISTRVGRAQGLVIASLFFCMMFTQAGVVLGGITGGVASAMSTVTGGAISAASSAKGQQVIEDSIGGLDFKSPPPEVIKGLAARVASGNDQSAITYLANQTGMSESDATARYQQFKDKFVAVGRQAALTTTSVMQYLGLTLFISILLGAVAAMVCGAWGAGYNLQMPVSKMDFKAMHLRPAPINN